MATDAINTIRSDIHRVKLRECETASSSLVETPSVVIKPQPMSVVTPLREMHVYGSLTPTVVPVRYHFKSEQNAQQHNSDLA